MDRFDEGTGLNQPPNWPFACAFDRDGAGLAFPRAPLGNGATRRSPLPRFVSDPTCLQGAVRVSGAEEAPRSRSCALLATEFPSDGLPDLGELALVNMSLNLLSESSGL